MARSEAQITQQENDDALRMLQESAADFTAKTRGVKRIRELRKGSSGFDPALWAQIAELGWTGLMIPEAHGGVGLGIAGACAVARELGRQLHPEPFVPCAVLAASLILASDNEQLKTELLSALCAGTVIPAVAWQEQLASFAPATMQAEANADGWLLTGHKRFVRPGTASGYIVTAVCREGLGLYWLPVGSAGMEVRLESGTDGMSLAQLHLNQVFVAPANQLISPSRGAAALDSAIDLAITASCAELCGLMNSALEMTLEYLRTRVQFDKPIGSFQALQHRAVDLYMQQELSSACLNEVIVQLSASNTAAARATLTSRLKARCSDAALKITREAIQMHGAIGFTDECDIGLFLKRALALSAWLGNAAEHRQRYAQQASIGKHHD